MPYPLKTSKKTSKSLKIWLIILKNSFNPNKILLFATVNFNYSYRAFLISCLLAGNLVLLLLTLRLSGGEIETETLTTVEYAPELLEDETDVISEEIKIETNTAYNEAEEFIAEIENNRNETEFLSEEIRQTDPATNGSQPNDLALNDAREKLNEVKEKLVVNSKNVKKPNTEGSVNKKTTISYQLIDRKAMRLRNPVYTCDQGGKVVISIEVNALGKVVKADYNKSASTTTNGCLIESALTYANQSKFNTAAKKEKQLGTITYFFPGQR